jgi:hypothetical protein
MCLKIYEHAEARDTRSKGPFSDVIRLFWRAYGWLAKLNFGSVVGCMRILHGRPVVWI